MTHYFLSDIIVLHIIKELWVKDVPLMFARPRLWKALILALSLTFAACHPLESPSGGVGVRTAVVTVTGTLRMVGNEPFTALVLETGDKRVYLVTGEMKQSLSEQQHRKVELTGVLERVDSPYSRDAIRVQNYKTTPEENK